LTSQEERLAGEILPSPAADRLIREHSK